MVLRTAYYLLDVLSVVDILRGVLGLLGDASILSLVELGSHVDDVV